MAPSFNQKVGIRQGCSLSPAIFVLILDYALKAYMQACEELGIQARHNFSPPGQVYQPSFKLSVLESHLDALFAGVCLLGSKKAFHSLDWETMWKVMEAQGMPDKIVAIIKELYTNATVSVRLNQEGGVAPSFESGDQTRMLIITNNLRSDTGLCVEGIYASM